MQYICAYACDTRSASGAEPVNGPAGRKKMLTMMLILLVRILAR